MKTFLFATLALLIAAPVAARSLKLRTQAQVISRTEKKPAQATCKSLAELKQALGAEYATVAKLLILEKIDFKKKMVVVIRAGRANAFGVRLSLLNFTRSKDGKTASVIWQYKPYFGGAAPPNQPGNPTLAIVLDRFDGPVKFQRKNWRYPKGLTLPPSAPPSRPRVPRIK
jgi:hypothetical protein